MCENASTQARGQAQRGEEERNKVSLSRIFFFSQWEMMEERDDGKERWKGEMEGRRWSEEMESEEDKAELLLVVFVW